MGGSGGIGLNNMTPNSTKEGKAKAFVCFSGLFSVKLLHWFPRCYFASCGLLFTSSIASRSLLGLSNDASV